MTPFEDLEIWKRSSRLSVAIYKYLHDCKESGFKDQITRTSLSVPCHIAAGFECNADKDAIKSFYDAKGSCGELRTQIYIGMELGYITKDIGPLWKNEAEQLSKMLAALIQSRTE